MRFLAVVLVFVLAFAAPASADDHWVPCVDEIGVIGADGVSCWTLADYEGLYGHPAWYGQFLVDVDAWSHEDHMAWIIRRTWPDHLADAAIALATCESGLRPDAANYTGLDLRLNNGSVGLFQQGVRFWPNRAEAAGVGGSHITDPWANSTVSAWLQQVGGWTHWENCRRKLGLPR